MKKLETATNSVVLVVALLAGYILVKQYLLPAPAGERVLATNTTIPAMMELKRLKQPTAVTHTMKKSDRSTPR